MKNLFKILSAILTAGIFIANLLTFGLALNNTEYAKSNDNFRSYFYSTMEVDGKEICYLENEYYKVYADLHGKYYYDLYQNNSFAEKISSNLYLNIKNSSEKQYITAIFRTMQANVTDTAKMVGLQENDIVTVCPSYPVAMIKIGAENIEAFLLNENVMAVYDAFSTLTENVLMTDEVFYEIYAPTAADARKILRYSAKLDSAPENAAEGKKFFFMSDTDLDGKITAVDARIALRISAKLEKGKTYAKSNGGQSGIWYEPYETLTK